MKIYMAPLEGITGYIYRNAYEKFFGGVDKYYAPFISPSEKCAMVPKDRKDLDPSNNSGICLVPQILTCKAEHFIDASNELMTLGYKEVNLNLGCPSGTVCSKRKGAGFLMETDLLKAFLDDIYEYGAAKGLDISIKTRLGYSDPDEFYYLVDIFNEFPISELTIHPRIRADYYKGEPRLEYYKYATEHCKAPLVYNGNVFSCDDYNRVVCEVGAGSVGADSLKAGSVKAVDRVMLGRGIISNPYLVEELRGSLADGSSAGRGSSGSSADDGLKRFWELHDYLYEEYKKFIAPDINVLYRMKELWSYWRLNFERLEDGRDYARDMKHLMKVKKLFEYENILNGIR